MRLEPCGLSLETGKLTLETSDLKIAPWDVKLVPRDLTLEQCVKRMRGLVPRSFLVAFVQNSMRRHGAGPRAHLFFVSKILWVELGYGIPNSYGYGKDMRPSPHLVGFNNTLL